MNPLMDKTARPDAISCLTINAGAHQRLTDTSTILHEAVEEDDCLFVVLLPLTLSRQQFPQTCLFS
jgi:hypothetical protein